MAVLEGLEDMVAVRAVRVAVLEAQEGMVAVPEVREDMVAVPEVRGRGLCVLLRPAQEARGLRLWVNRDRT